MSANGSTLFANGESRSLMICGWDGNLFTRSKTVAGSAADEVSWAWLGSTEAGLPRDGRDIGEISLLDGGFDNGIHFARESTLARS